MASSKNFFTGNDKSPTIEEFIKRQKSLWPKHWKCLWHLFKDETAIWWRSVDSKKLLSLIDEEFEKFLLRKWSHAGKQDNEKHVGLFLTGITLLQVHGLIQKEKMIVSINLSYKHNFIMLI